MSEGQDPSPLANVNSTALAAAVRRGFHLFREGDPKILSDEFALPLSGLSPEEVMAMPSPSQTSAGWVLRGRYAEDRLAAARVRLNQYVILGAGLDSFALRHAADSNELVVFEVDEPAMLVWKEARFKELGLEAPRQLRFTPCDFEHSSIAGALANTGFVPEAPAFISWLGVTQYLSPASISDTLRWAAGCAPGSEITLTFVVPGPEADAERARLAARNIDFATFFTPDQMTGLFQEAGFHRIEHFSPEQANEVYFFGRNDGLCAPILERLVSATVG